MTVSANSKELKKVRTELSTLKLRINELADELHLAKKELAKFKNNVASDVKYLTDRVDGQD